MTIILANYGWVRITRNHDVSKPDSLHASGRSLEYKR